MVSGFLCCLTSHIFYEGIGRYKTLLLMTIVNIICYGLSSYKNLNMFFVVRFVLGYTHCLSTIIAPLVIKELIPA